MTHEELLAKLDELDHSCSVVGITVGALRAVVEVHKPHITLVNRTTGATRQKCRCEADYPCPTIRAIEKELK